MNEADDSVVSEHVVAWALDIGGDIEVDVLPPSMLGRGPDPRIGQILLVFSRLDDEIHDLTKSCHSAEERQRVRALRFERDRIRYARSHAFLRSCLAALLGCHPVQVRIVTVANGKPVLAASPAHGSNLHFSMSRSGDVCVLAVSGSPVGVDIERIRPIAEMRAMAMNLWGTAALKRLDQISDETEQRAIFFRWWTGHEATVKCSGAGLGDEIADLPDSCSGRIGWLQELPWLPAGSAA